MGDGSGIPVEMTHLLPVRGAGRAVVRVHLYARRARRRLGASGVRLECRARWRYNGSDGQELASRPRSRSRPSRSTSTRRGRRDEPRPPRRRSGQGGRLSRRRRAADVLRRLQRPGDGPGDPRPRGRDEPRGDGPRRPGVRVGRAGLRRRRDHHTATCKEIYERRTGGLLRLRVRSRPTRTVQRTVRGTWTNIVRGV